MQNLLRFWYLIVPAGVVLAISGIWASANGGAKADRKAALALLSEAQMEVTASGLSFIGWDDADTSAEASSVHFIGWGDTDTSAEASGLHFVGWGDTGTSAEASALHFVGWGNPDNSAEASVAHFVGLGDRAFVIDTFDDGLHSWESSDGAESLRVSEAGTLCVSDLVRPSTFLTPPAKFLGDWGGRDGTLSFRVYYEGTVQWPIVITIQSPHGSAVRSDILNAYNDLNYEDVEVPINQHWWEETGDWDAIARSVESISIEFDMKDGLSEDPEGCIDNFKLTKGHRG